MHRTFIDLFRILILEIGGRMKEKNGITLRIILLFWFFR